MFPTSKWGSSIEQLRYPCSLLGVVTQWSLKAPPNPNHFLILFANKQHSSNVHHFDKCLIFLAFLSNQNQPPRARKPVEGKNFSTLVLSSPE